MTPERMRALADEAWNTADLSISEDRAGGYEEVVAGLRAVIENAPHADWCMIHALIKYERICTCWKADVL